MGTLGLIIFHQAQFSGWLHSHLGISGFWVWIATFLTAMIAGMLGSWIGSLIRRLPLVGPFDSAAGAVVHAAVVLVGIYLGLAAIISLGRIYGPLVHAAYLDSGEIATLQRQLDALPLLRGSLSNKNLALIHQQVGSGSVQVGLDPQLKQFVEFYGSTIKPQLCGSRLAPVVLEVGNRIPLLSFVGTPTVPRC